MNAITRNEIARLDAPVIEFTLNGQPGGQRIWAAITVAAESPVHQTAREAVLANDLEVTLQGEAHEPLKDVTFSFRAKGQRVNGRVGQGVRADFRSDAFVRLERAR